MGGFDEIIGKVTEAIGGPKGEQSGLIESIMGMVTSEESGGLAGLVSGFREKGFGDVVSSWVSTGSNLPISTEQLQQGIGMEKIRQLAEKAGLSPEVAKSRLAELLPDIVDKLTPEGKIPEGGDLLAKTAGFFKDRLHV